MGTFGVFSCRMRESGSPLFPVSLPVRLVTPTFRSHLVFFYHQEESESESESESEGRGEVR